METLILIIGLSITLIVLRLVSDPPEDLEYLRKNWKLLHAEKCGNDSCFAILTVETPNGIKRFQGRCHYRDADTSDVCSMQQMKLLEEFWHKANSEGKFDE